MSQKTTILFASPYEGFQESIMQSFPESEVLYAPSLEEGERIFTIHKDRIAVVIVASFANIASASAPASIPFVKKVKRESNARVIGISSVYTFAEKFFDAGCDDVCVPQSILKCAQRFLVGAAE